MTACPECTGLGCAECSTKPLSENEVESLVVKFMRAKGWIACRNHIGVLPNGWRLGKKYTPDWTFQKPVSSGLYLICHIEVKREGVRLSPTCKKDKGQLEAIAKLNHIGQPATWINSLDMLQLWYDKQGW